MQDKQFDDWDMFPFGFSEYIAPHLGKGIWASKDDITRVADYLKTCLKFKFRQYDSIAILAHGTGGLVVQQALLELDEKRLLDITHVLLFGTPSGGLKSNYLERIFNKKYRDLDANGALITSLRDGWNKRFKNPSFNFKSIAAIRDEFVPSASSFDPFQEEETLMVSGSHFSMIKPKSPDDESVLLIKNLLTEGMQLEETTNDEDKKKELIQVEVLPKKLDEEVASLMVQGFGGVVTKLTEEQADYINVPQDGPFKEDSYKY